MVVPLTVVRLTDTHRAAVVELGMNHPGEIARLAAIAAPTVALVNNAQREHQEFMHTVEAVALENGAVFAALPIDGVAVYPGDDTYTALWQGLAAHCRSLTFGLSDACDVRASYVSTGFGNNLKVTAPGGEFALKLAAAGEHNVRNALAAVACALAAISLPTSCMPFAKIWLDFTSASTLPWPKVTSCSAVCIIGS